MGKHHFDDLPAGVLWHGRGVMDDCGASAGLNLSERDYE